MGEAQRGYDAPGGPWTTVVLKVGERTLTNGNGSHAGDGHAGDDHSGLAVDKPGPIENLSQSSNQDGGIGRNPFFLTQPKGR